VGFVKKTKVYTIEFEGEYEGLVVRARGASAGEYLDIAQLVTSLDTPQLSKKARGRGAKKPDDLKDVAGVFELFRDFGKYLVSWNMQRQLPDSDEIVDVPATAEGMLSCDLEDVLVVISGWMDAVGGVAAPLESSSPSGKQPAKGLQIPMETLSGSPLS
jgi:hypothetical protein